MFQRTVRKHPNRVCLHFEDQACSSFIVRIIVVITTTIKSPPPSPQAWTFKQLDEFSNRVAHHLIRFILITFLFVALVNNLFSAGFKHGDSVALFMENRPEYIGVLYLSLSSSCSLTIAITNLRSFLNVCFLAKILPQQNKHILSPSMISGHSLLAKI